MKESLDAVGLLKFIDHYPWQLSGGMQQRVAIARALACQPRVLLMDEPFASVDAQTRAELEDLVLRIHAEFEVTMLLVTHDIDESVYMSDRVIILTASPSYVQEVLPIDLPRPRAQDVTKALPEFASLRTHVYRAITEAHSKHGVPPTTVGNRSLAQSFASGQSSKFVAIRRYAIYSIDHSEAQSSTARRGGTKCVAVGGFPSE